MIKIKINEMFDSRDRWVTNKDGKFYTHLIIKRKRIEIAVFDNEADARTMAGLLECVRYHDLSKVKCIQTYCLKKFNNILSILEDSKVKENKVEYKKTRKFFSMKDLYGPNYSNSGTEAFDFNEKYKDYWDRL